MSRFSCEGWGVAGDASNSEFFEVDYEPRERVRPPDGDDRDRLAGPWLR
jgi:hypothetical protein